jgi:flavin reductase (DIM6/NTAB) family NADH-FMN oxidoreductase RutF
MTDAPKHPISPDPANELASDSSVIDPRDFRNALGTYATGITIITAAAADGQPYGLTCNSFASVSLNPPLVLWSLGIFSQGMNIFQNASHFAVNVLGASQQALATRFAKSLEDKFAGVEWRPGLGGAPLLADSVANFQCRAANRYYGGDHVIFLGAVEAYSYNRREPLLFARGGYGRFLTADDVSATPKP